jgi:hypothetical protein
MYTSIPILDHANQIVDYRDHLLLARQIGYSGSLHVPKHVVEG